MLISILTMATAGAGIGPPSTDHQEFFSTTNRLKLLPGPTLHQSLLNGLPLRCSALQYSVLLILAGKKEGSFQQATDHDSPQLRFFLGLWSVGLLAWHPCHRFCPDEPGPVVWLPRTWSRPRLRLLCLPRRLFCWASSVPELVIGELALASLIRTLMTVVGTRRMP